MYIFQSELEINEMIKNLRAADTDKDNPNFITISEEEFIKSYPNMLEALDHAPSKSSARMGVDISFNNLSLEVELSSKKIRILDSLTGRIHGGTMFALMGGSGMICISKIIWIIFYLNFNINASLRCWKNVLVEFTMWPSVLWQSFWSNIH